MISTRGPLPIGTCMLRPCDIAMLHLHERKRVMRTTVVAVVAVPVVVLLAIHAAGFETKEGQKVAVLVSTKCVGSIFRA